MRVETALMVLVLGCSRSQPVPASEPLPVLAVEQVKAAPSPPAVSLATSEPAAIAEPVQIPARARAQQSPRAFEVETEAGRTTILDRGASKPLSRFDAKRLADRCSRRPTTWSRERCLERGLY
jgi:hypothetical protein